MGDVIDFIAYKNNKEINNRMKYDTINYVSIRGNYVTGYNLYIDDISSSVTKNSLIEYLIKFTKIESIDIGYINILTSVLISISPNKIYFYLEPNDSKEFVFILTNLFNNKLVLIE